MEPPAKRMRILQSVEVDEDNVEYIKAKQRQQQKLKSRFESIFEKFGNMNPSQSDEIDMKTNTVVVDRGHLRRLKRQTNGKEKSLLEKIVLGAGNHLEDDDNDGEEAEGEDSEDELTLTPQPVKSKTAGPPEQDMSKRSTEATETNVQQLALPQSSFPATSMPQFDVPQTPNTPNPTADLLRYVQFPQTPAGQQAQNAFHANLLQTINQAVHKAVAGLILPNVPMALANTAPAPTTPMTTDDKVAPATDPKWFFPPLTARQRQCPVAQSSPLSYHTAASRAKDTVQQYSDIAPIEATEEKPLATTCRRPNESSPTRPRRTSPRVEIQRRVPRTARKYHFTHEDDVYISKRKRIDGVSWAAIKDSRQKWKDWPMSVLHNRWILIKGQNLHLQEPAVAPTAGRADAKHSSVDRIAPSSKTSHHLPTPSSSEHEEYHEGFVESTKESVQQMPSSSAHFDDDDRDLLSLAGDDSDEDLPMISNDGNDNTPLDVSEDVILPSIEARDLVDESTMQEDLLVELPTQDSVETPTRQSSCITVKAEPAFSSPTTLRQRKQSTPLAETIPDSQGHGDDTQDEHIVTSPNNTDYRPSRISEPTTAQQTNQRNTCTTSSLRSASLDLIDTSAKDELLLSPPTPTTPSRKHNHESTTPATTSLAPSYQTPKVRDIDGSSDKGSKSTSKADRKAFHKRIKREWTRKGTPAKESAAKRKCLGGLEVRKRRWVDVDGEGSADELAVF
jgi:hypothetical protein